MAVGKNYIILEPGVLSTRSVSDTCLFIALRAGFLGHTGIPTMFLFFS